MCEVLTGAMSEAGIGAVLGWLLSYVVEWWPAWETLPAREKRIALLLLCLAIGIALLLLSWQLCGAALDQEAVWAALTAAFAAFTASQVSHIRKL